MLEFNHTSPPDETRFTVGDHVWLLATNVKTRRPAKKLDDKKLGPFEVSKFISDYAYRLKLPPSMRIHNVFHARLLHPYKPDLKFQRNQPQPPAVVTEDGEEEYEVGKIISWVQDSRGLRYRVHWKGDSNQEDTEERAEKFAHMHELMEDFLRREPSAPVPPDYQPRHALRRSPCNDQRSSNQTAKSALLVPTPTTHLSNTTSLSSTHTPIQTILANSHDVELPHDHCHEGRPNRHIQSPPHGAFPETRPHARRDGQRVPDLPLREGPEAQGVHMEGPRGTAGDKAQNDEGKRLGVQGHDCPYMRKNVLVGEMVSRGAWRDLKDGQGAVEVGERQLHAGGGMDSWTTGGGAPDVG